ncbi:MAG: hypothetical protein ACKOCE_00980 [Acidimicrobiia bacterium]
MKRPVRVVLVAIVLVACGPGSTVPAGPFSVDPLGALLARARTRLDGANGPDTWEVAVCRVPVGVADPYYADVDGRMKRSAEEIVGLLEPVSDYFARWSGGAYVPRFVPATREVSILADESSPECVERAIDQSADESDGVIVIADAQHAEDVEGGRGGPGRPCTDDCSARATRRYVYVGASDFMPMWNDTPPLDLIEHELGHGLDWPHSSLTEQGLGGHSYDSPFDLMSDSAAARSAEPTRRHGPGALAIDLVAVGWIGRERVVETLGGRSTVEIGARSAPEGPVLVVVPLDGTSLLTVELVSAAGDDGFHDSDFVIVHRVEFGDEREEASGIDRRQFAVSGELRAGDRWQGEGRGVRVVGIAGGIARLEISAGA